MTATVPCPNCHATFTIERAQPLVSCPYCRNSFQSHSLARAQVHAQQYADHQQEAQRHAEWAASHASVAEATKPTTPWGMLLSFPLMGIIGLGATSGMGGAALIDNEVWLYVSVGLGLVAVVGMTAAVIAHSRRVAVAGAAPLPHGQRVGVSCPNCGAPSELVHGQAVGACNYCNSALVPGAELMAQAIDAAKMQVRYELFRAAREDRRADQRIAAMSRDYATIWVPGLVLVSAVLVAVLGGDAEMTVLAWAIAIGLTTVVVGRHAVRATRHAALRSVFQNMAVQLRGQVVDFDGATQWLDAYWPGSHMQAFWYNNHRTFVALVGNLYGYSCYLQILPVNDFPSNGYAVLNLACVFEDRFASAITPPAKEMKRWLKKKGFDLTFEDGGVSAVRDLKKSPAYWKSAEAAHELATIAAHLAHLAHQLGGHATPAMPA